MNTEWNPIWRVDLIDIDGITPPVMAEYPDNYRWNGWLCPMLDAWSVVAVMEALRVEYDGQPHPGPDYDFDEDGALLLTEYDVDDRAYVDRMPANEDGLYPLGSHAWVWSRTSLQDDEDI